MVSRDVGTRLLFENDRVRVWDMTLEAGESSHQHLHSSDYLFVYLEPSHIELVVEGASKGIYRCNDGFVQYTEVAEGLPPHSIRNVGNRTHRQVLVEFKDESRASEIRTQDNGRYIE